MVKILAKKSGNCGCFNCGKVQDGYKMQPYTVWHKLDSEKRGHNDPACSMECARALATRFEREEV